MIDAGVLYESPGARQPVGGLALVETPRCFGIEERPHSMLNLPEAHCSPELRSTSSNPMFMLQPGGKQLLVVGSPILTPSAELFRGDGTTALLVGRRRS